MTKKKKFNNIDSRVMDKVSFYESVRSKVAAEEGKAADTESPLLARRARYDFVNVYTLLGRMSEASLI